MSLKTKKKKKYGNDFTMHEENKEKNKRSLLNGPKHKTNIYNQTKLENENRNKTKSGRTTKTPRKFKDFIWKKKSNILLCASSENNLLNNENVNIPDAKHVINNCKDMHIMEKQLVENRKTSYRMRKTPQKLKDFIWERVSKKFPDYEKKYDGRDVLSFNESEINNDAVENIQSLDYCKDVNVVNRDKHPGLRIGSDIESDSSSNDNNSNTITINEINTQDIGYNIESHRKNKEKFKSSIWKMSKKNLKKFFQKKKDVRKTLLQCERESTEDYNTKNTEHNKISDISKPLNVTKKMQDKHLSPSIDSDGNCTDNSANKKKSLKNSIIDNCENSHAGKTKKRGKHTSSITNSFIMLESTHSDNSDTNSINRMKPKRKKHKAKNKISENCEDLHARKKKGDNKHSETTSINENCNDMRFRKKKKKLQHIHSSFNSDIYSNLTFSDNDSSNKISKKVNKSFESEECSTQNTGNIKNSDKFKDLHVRKKKKGDKHTSSNINSDCNSTFNTFSDVYSDQNLNIDSPDEEPLNPDNENQNENVTKNDFRFYVSKENWSKISIKKGPYSRHLAGNDWTTILSKSFNKVEPRCVLAFKYNRISMQDNSRRGPYGKFRAICTHKECKCKYTMTIFDVPSKDSDVEFIVKQSGTPKPINSPKGRKFMGEKRKMLLEELHHAKSAYAVYYKSLADAPKEQLKAGNLSEVPSKDVLRKIKSNENAHEKLCDSVVQECEIIRQAIELLSSDDECYINNIGLNPFYLINFTKEQIKILNDACSKKDAFIHLDATGISCKKPPNQKKRMYLYNFYLKSKRKNMRLAEMITNDQTAVNITNFLLRIRYAMTLKRTYKAPQKFETDFSFALIKSVLLAFNSMELSTYLEKCFEVLNTTEESTLSKRYSVIHICSTHVLKLFRNIIATNIKKGNRTFWTYTLARLLETHKLKTVKRMWTNMVTIGKSSFVDTKVNESMNYIMKKINYQKDDNDEDDDLDNPETLDTDEPGIISGQIRKDSPFRTFFAQLTEDAYVCNIGTKENVNEYKAPNLVINLNKNYMPLYPLWSGAMLSGRQFQEGLKRDSNAVVEQDFSTLKHSVIPQGKGTRPANICLKLYTATKGQLKEMTIPEAKSDIKKKNVSKVHEKEFTQEQEVWQRKNKNDSPRKSKKSIYFNYPDKKLKSKNIEYNFFTSSNFMPWGGKKNSSEPLNITNTCSFDNILMVIYMITTVRPDVKTELSKTNNSYIQVILELMEDMKNHNWFEAKRKFLSDVKQVDVRNKLTKINCYGAEDLWIINYFLPLQCFIKKKIEKCKCRAVRNPKEASEIRFIMHKKPDRRQTIQDLFFNWERKMECLRCNTEVDATIEFTRNTPVILFVCVSDMSKDDLLETDSLSKPVMLLGHGYELYGATASIGGHFIAYMKDANQFQLYDGFNENYILRQKIPRRYNLNYLIYVKSHIDII